MALIFNKPMTTTRIDEIKKLQAENAKLRELLKEFRELLKRARWLYEMANSFRCSETQSTEIQIDVDEAIRKETR
jgi:hypothetical protein